jgi:hypothetical protein
LVEGRGAGETSVGAVEGVTGAALTSVCGAFFAHAPPIIATTIIATQIVLPRVITILL